MICTECAIAKRICTREQGVSSKVIRLKHPRLETRICQSIIVMVSVDDREEQLLVPGKAPTCFKSGEICESGCFVSFKRHIFLKKITQSASIVSILSKIDIK